MKLLKFVLFLGLLLQLNVLAAAWHPVPVVADGQTVQYSPLSTVSRPWRICVLLPNGQDKFWWGVAWGIAEEADRWGVELGIYDAGGYENIGVQLQQLKYCMQLDADAYVISAVNASDLTPALQKLKQLNKPVIDLMNGLPAEWVTSRTDGLTKLMVEQLITRLQHKKLPRKSLVAWFPGPANSDWVMQANQSVDKFLTEQEAVVVTAGYAGTDPFAQANLIREFFKDQRKSFDYIIANAVAAQLIATYQSNKPQTAARTQPDLYAFYSNPDVVTAIKAGLVAGAPSNQPVLQARIALDLALRALEHKTVPAVIQVEVVWLDPQSVKAIDLSTLIAPSEQWMIKRELKAR